MPCYAKLLEAQCDERKCLLAQALQADILQIKGGSSCTASGSKRNLNFLSVLDHRQKIIQRNEQCQNTLEHQLKMSKSLRTWQILHI